MAQSLQMVFKTVGGKSLALVVNEPKENLTKAQVEAVMQAVIATNAIETAKGDKPAAIKEIFVISKDKQLLIA